MEIWYIEVGGQVLYLIVTQMDKKGINRLKVVLVEKKRTNKWLAEQLEVNPTTISKWCTNSSQPPLELLLKTAQLLDVEITELIRMNNQ